MKSFNTFIERSFILFPVFTAAGTLLSLRAHWSCALLFPYLIPLLAFRTFDLFYPLKEGGHPIISRHGICPWSVGFHIQRIYFIFPFIERILMAVPGLYSLWLRLWGSRIGKNIHWINTTVTDRSGLIIGDNVFFGNECYLSAHVAAHKGGRMILYFKKITIGNNCFVGAFSMFGPGARVPDFSLLSIKTGLKVNEVFDPKKVTDVTSV